MSEGKNEILETRIGGLGSSDAKMCAKIGRNGVIGVSDRKRIAIMLGLDEQRQFTSAATEHGNFIESEIYKLLVAKYKNAVSNPYTKHEELSKTLGFDVFNHIDWEVKTDTKLIWFECKATNKSTDETEQEYFDQLCWHTMIGYDKAKKLGLKFELYLVHYFSVEKELTFDPIKFATKKIEIAIDLYDNDIISGLNIIANEIKNGFEYEKQEELDICELPEFLQDATYEIQSVILKQKDDNKKIELFKEQLKDFMAKNNIKSFNNEFFSIVYVADTVATKIDSKKLKSELPDIFAKYSKQSNVKSSVRLTIKE